MNFDEHINEVKCGFARIFEWFNLQMHFDKIYKLMINLIMFFIQC